MDRSERILMTARVDGWVVDDETVALLSVYSPRRGGCKLKRGEEQRLLLLLYREDDVVIKEIREEQNVAKSKYLNFFITSCRCARVESDSEG